MADAAAGRRLCAGATGAAGPASRAQRAPVRGHEVARDREAQSRSARSRALDESIEDVGKDRGIDTRAGVRDPQLESVARHVAADRDRAARRRVPDRVRDQVGEHLTEEREELEALSAVSARDHDVAESVGAQGLIIQYDIIIY